MLEMFAKKVQKVKLCVMERKSKGEIGTWLSWGLGAVIVIIIIWPFAKNIVSDFFTVVQTWFSTNASKIFTNLP